MSPCWYEWSVFITLEPLSCQKARMELERGEQVEGGVKQKAYLHTLGLFVFTHAHSPLLQPLPPQVGQFTVRLFNFPEIGMWQLCHADEESGSLSHLICLRSGTAPPSSSSSALFTSSCCFTPPPKSQTLSLNEYTSHSLLNCSVQERGGWLTPEEDKTNNWELFFLFNLHRLL